MIYFEMSIFRRSSKLIYSKWYCLIKNNKITRRRPYCLFNSVSEAIQCGLSKGRWFGKTEKSKWAKRYEIHTPLNRSF